MHSTTALHLRLVVAYCILQEVGLQRWQDAMVNSSRSICMYACTTVIIDAVASMMTVFDCRLVQSRVVYMSFNLTLFDCRLVQSRVVNVSFNLTLFDCRLVQSRVVYLSFNLTRIKLLVPPIANLDLEAIMARKAAKGRRTYIWISPTLPC